MAELSYPWNPGDPGGDADLGAWINIMRALGQGGVLIGEGAELAISASGGFQISVATGKATALGHHYENNATKVIALVANGTGAIRYDRAVIQFDVQNRTALAKVIAGTNAGPPALNADPTNLTDVNLGVISVGVGTPSIPSGSVFPALDRWAAPVNQQGQVGQLIDYTGRISTVSKLYVPCFGQGLATPTISRWSYEKLWNIWPTMGGLATPPFFGHHYDGSDRLVFPDLRDRATFGVDDMGQGPSKAMGLIDAGGQPSLGMFLGSGALQVADLPEHHHIFRNHATAPRFVWEVIGPTTHRLMTGTGNGTYVEVSTMDSIFETLGLPHPTGASTDDTPGAPPSPDNRMPPAFLCYKVVRVA